MIRRRSPPLSDRPWGSLSGVPPSLIPSGAVVTLTAPPLCANGPRSQRHVFVAMGVAFDGAGHGERRDVTGIGQEVDAERGRVAAVPLGADPEAIRAVEQLLLERIELRVGVRRAELAEQRFLREDSRLLEGPADADAQDERRARGRPRRLDTLDDPLLHAGPTPRRGGRPLPR